MEACKAESTQAIYEGIDGRLEAKTSRKQTELERVRERLRDLSTPNSTVPPFLLSLCFFLSLFVLLCSSPFNLGCCWSSRLACHFFVHVFFLLEIISGSLPNKF